MMNHEAMGRMNVTTEAYTPLLDKSLLTAINVLINGVVLLKHMMRSIYAKSTVH